MTENVKSKEMLEALAAPFPPQDIEWRVQSATRGQNGVIKLLVLPYIESRAVMTRLDSVCGANWQTHFDKIEVKGKEAFQCRLSIKIGEEWITRTDAAEVSDIESVKGGHSNALKRSAVQWSIGRYLYDCPQFWVELKQRGEHRVWGKFKIGGQMEQVSGYFDTPNLPDWALPAERSVKTPKKQEQTQKQPSESQTKPVSQGTKTQNNDEQQQAVHHVKQLLQHLNVPLQFVGPLLKRVSGSDVELEKASTENLRELYKVLAPVYNYVAECTSLGLKEKDMLFYAKIVLKVELENIHSLYFKMTKKELEQALELVHGDSKKAV